MATPSPAEEPGPRQVAEDVAAIDWPAELACHERWLRTVVAARLGHRSAVDEVMQEVSLAVLRQQAPLRDATKVSPWLYRTAVLQALLHRRKAGRRKRLADRFGERRRPLESDCRESDPLDWLIADERSRLVREGLGRLAPRDAEILLLKYTENWSYHELAAHLGISHSAVEARLHRARQRLRQALAAVAPAELAH
ncbi:MAG: RNA polymerase sigma factor [Pirellulales bacterium]